MKSADIFVVVDMVQAITEMSTTDRTIGRLIAWRPTSEEAIAYMEMLQKQADELAGALSDIRAAQANASYGPADCNRRAVAVGEIRTVQDTAQIVQEWKRIVRGLNQRENEIIEHALRTLLDPSIVRYRTQSYPQSANAFIYADYQIRKVPG